MKQGLYDIVWAIEVVSLGEAPWIKLLQALHIKSQGAKRE
jgi:hypothetical protein